MEKSMKNYRRCRQEQCGYFLQGGCKSCSKCSAEPYLLKIKPLCKICMDCANKEGFLRFEDKQIKEVEESESEMITETEKALLTQIFGNITKREVEKKKKKKEKPMVIQNGISGRASN